MTKQEILDVSKLRNEFLSALRKQHGDDAYQHRHNPKMDSATTAAARARFYAASNALK